MAKSEDNSPKWAKVIKRKKVDKPKIVSKIVIIKISGNRHVKVLQMGDKAVVRVAGEIIFNNLKTEVNFDKWWENTIDIIGKNSTIDVIKSEVVDNKAMKLIHEKYGG